MTPTTLTVQHTPHVAAWYHVLSCFELAGDSWSCHNPAYLKTVDPLRPPGIQKPNNHLGAFHTLYRQGELREALHILPLLFKEEESFKATAQSLIHGTPPPNALPTESKRAIAPLASDAGGKLVQLVMSLADSELNHYLAMHYRQSESALNNVASGLTGVLNKHLPPLVDVLFPQMAQTIVVFLCESLTGQNRSIQPIRRTHHIATFPRPTAYHAFFHVLMSLTQRRSDRVIRHYFPEKVAAEGNGLLAQQMRFDAAITTTYHLLLRYDQGLLTHFTPWAMDQFIRTPRQPKAAVAALPEFYLVPEEAEPALRTLLGESDSD